MTTGTETDAVGSREAVNRVAVREVVAGTDDDRDGRGGRAAARTRERATPAMRIPYPNTAKLNNPQVRTRGGCARGGPFGLGPPRPLTTSTYVH
jgi:hypothetical protein